MRLFHRIRDRWRVRRTLRKVAPLLVRRYGKSASYTQGQILRSARDAGLSEAHIMTAYVLFMREKEFAAAFGGELLQDSASERLLVGDLYFGGATDYSAIDVVDRAGESVWSGDSSFDGGWQDDGDS